jgi:rfaE bifunctional protein nucleotidyltransferase chain/domain
MFGPGSNPAQRFIRDYDELVRRAEACRALGLKIVLTSGTYDILHVGHSRYLERSKELAEGGILIVGVDSDEKVRSRKGPNRPIVPEDERVEVLCHIRHVDLVTVKPLDAPHWELIRRIRPHVLVTTQEEYEDPDEEQKLRAFCAEFGGEVHILPPQATTSTTAKIRLLVLGLKRKVKERLEEVITWIDEL